MLRAVAYPRYSSDNQREESITAQMRAIEEYCQSKGYALVGSYPDEARSATTDNRPNFQRMIADSAKGLFDVVVVHKLDRFARDRYDSAFYKRSLRLNGVRLESVLEQFDGSPESIILESVLEGMAEYYSKNLAREARKGMMENAQKGLHNGGRPPYGYQVNPETKRLEIEEREAKAVRTYFEGIVARTSLSKIAQAINDMGLRTRGGRRFTKNSFDGWASNTKYKGVYTWDVSSAKNEEGKRNNHSKKPTEKQIVLPGAVPAIVSEDLWERVNQVMTDRKHTGAATRTPMDYLLSGKVVCGNPACGAPFSGNSYVSKGTRYSYYQCNKQCGNQKLRKNDLEQMIIDELLETCFTDEAIEQIVDRVKRLYKAQQASSTTETEPLLSELDVLERRIQNWVTAIGDGVLDIDMVGENLAEAKRRRVVLKTEIQRLELIQSAGQLDDALIRAEILHRKELLESDDPAKVKQILQELVDAVVVHYSSDDPNDEKTIEVKVRGMHGGGGATPLIPLTAKDKLQLVYRR